MFKKRGTSASPAPASDSSDSEGRRRRRLSKRLTNQSAHNLRLEALPQSEDASVYSSMTDFDLNNSKPYNVLDQQKDNVKPQTADSKSVLPTAGPTTSEAASWQGTAFLVKKFEMVQATAALSETHSTPVKKTKRPFSSIFSSSRSSPNHSNDNLDLAKDSPASNTSPANSRDDVSIVPSLKTPSRASYTHGMKKAPNGDKPSNTSHLSNQELADRVKNCPVHGPKHKTALSVDEWKPPPRITRTETPADLDYTHLGRLRLGSLQIMNGRASPAPSELSKQFKPRPSSNLRRDVSSEYGDGEAADLPTLSNLWSPNDHLDSVGNSAPQISAPDPVKTGEDVADEVVEPDTKTKASDVLMHSPNRFVVPKRKPISSPDRTSMMAKAYMAELPDSPYASHQPSSPTVSMAIDDVEPTHLGYHLPQHEETTPSAATEAERITPIALFTPDGFDCHLDTQGDSRAEPARDSWFAPSRDSWVEPSRDSEVEPSRQASPQKVQPPLLLRPSEKSEDSGYSSNVSLRDDVSEEITPAPEQTSTYQSRHADLPAATARRLGPRPTRPVSILKQQRATAPVLPTFANLQLITSPTPSTNSTLTVKSEKSPKPRKLQKHRPKSQPLPLELITVQGAHLDSDLVVPPIPERILANLSIRTQEVPELDRTYKSMHHVKNQASVSTMSIAMPDIRFPSPDHVAQPQISRSNLGRPSSIRRVSLLGFGKSAKRMSQPPPARGISEWEAQAIIHDFGTFTSNLGGSPYDVAHDRRPGPPPHANTSPYPVPAPDHRRPRSMMDDETAAELSRLRSRSIVERENAHQHIKRSSFNDRGGIPGKNLRPGSVASDTPPLPPLPRKGDAWQRDNRRSPEHRFNETRDSDRSWSEDQYWDAEDHFAPIPPKHSPRPSYIEPADKIEDISLAPPPPSHSPQPQIIASPVSPGDWAAQAEAWKSKRMIASGMLEEQHSFEERRSIENRKSLDTGRQQYQPYRPKIYEPEPAPKPTPTAEPLYPEIPPRQLEPITNSHTRFPSLVGALPPMDFLKNIHTTPRPLPTPAGDSYWAHQIERPSSRNSQFSFAPSLAENLHPADLERPQPPPQFGRYSGGMDYAYERGAGFGGSAGTRSVSGEAGATRKGVSLRAGYGIDLGDVPVMAGKREL